MKKSLLLHVFVSFALCLASLALSTAFAADSGATVPLVLKLPAPALKGTPKDIPITDNIEAPSDKPRAPMMVPAGLKNIAPSAKITSSDKNASPDALAKLVDGEKEATDENIVSFRKGTQWVQLDFGAPQEIFAVVIWHAYNSGQIYHDVIVRVSDDPNFVENVHTVYNNDYDNSSGLGAGTDKEYFESNEGRLIDAKGVKGRYVRFYSKGSTDGVLNEYTELEVYGRPAK
jgi:hypothetical protein